MERELTKVIRRLATASFNVRNKDIEPSDIDLHADNDWARAEAVYRELIKIDQERELPPFLIYETLTGRLVSLATPTEAEGHTVPAGARFIGGWYFTQKENYSYLQELLCE